MEQKFTQMAQEALSDAVQNAAALGNPQVDTLHLLDAMLRQENSMARALIEAAGGNAQNVSAEVHQAMQSLPSASGSTTTQPDVSRQLSAVLSQAEKEMQRRGDEYVHRRPHGWSQSRPRNRIKARTSWKRTVLPRISCVTP